jgi:UDP-N-acetylglucosamine diphosphorylase / glucose-1-phosphate thymidylyltransferase / UDP-N-acetylgalactosamine diphosphorylase / glucosamine-1-phosphate N-acetyltransferase / galactosamine-1-phosphate N-acetyltransferase
VRLILIDLEGPRRLGFEPLVLCRPIWELRLGITTLAEKLVAAVGTRDVACFVPPYMAEVYRRETAWPVNDPAQLQGDDLFIAAAHVKAASIPRQIGGPSHVVLDAAGQVLLAFVTRDDAAAWRAASLEAFLETVKRLPAVERRTDAWNYTWDLILANPAEIAADFAALGRSGIEGAIEQPAALQGGHQEIYVAPGARVHPMTVIDASAGPVYIDEGAEVQPFTRIEGPCYLGKRSLLLGAKCRAGNTIGPLCRIGGEVEGSVIQGYSNKYHDGFLGHAYLGQWVNLGAMTTNSDLKNDYSPVSVTLRDKTRIDTGSMKVGSLIGDHAKTAIGTLLNTGAYVGAMTLILGDGRLLPKFIPSFAWYLQGTLATSAANKERAYDTARRAMARRDCAWTAADAALWDEVYRRETGGA